VNDTITLPPPVIVMPPPSFSKWQREHAAFQRLLPGLLDAHRGKFVAIHGEQVVDVGDDKLALALRVLAKLGNIDIHVGLVTDSPPPIARSGVRREVHTLGGDV
jgi:hypothetical protein